MNYSPEWTHHPYIQTDNGGRFPGSRPEFAPAFPRFRAVTGPGCICRLQWRIPLPLLTGFPFTY